MEKEFVPYQQALELKELGFNEECFGYFIESGEWIPSSYALGSGAYPTNSDLLPGWVSSPLLSQVFKWVREKTWYFYSA